MMSDYDDAVALWESTPGMGLNFSDADSRAGIRSYLRRNPRMSFVARDGNAMIGSVLCGHDGRRGYLHYLAVIPAYRRKGIGNALVEHCLKALDSRGIKRCNIFVFGDNASGLRFWKAVGWKKYDGLSLMYRPTDAAGESTSPARSRKRR